jgi:F0F1-type ATP synthase membrane subunit b/b'
VFPDLTVFWALVFILLTGVVLNQLLLEPLQRAMRERESAVKSARMLAESAAARARGATSEFEAQTQAARSEIYREMDEKRRRALERRAELLGRTRAEAEASIREASERLRTQTAAARIRLEQEAEAMGKAIEERVLGRRAS